MAEDRVNQFKNDNRGSIESCNKRREDATVQLRKARREVQLAKRRNLSENDNSGENVTLEELDKHANIILTSDPSEVLESVRYCRCLLTCEPEPPIDQVFNSGIIPRLIFFLTLKDNPKLQFEATWTLTNMASGSNRQTRNLVDLQIIPELMKLLSSDASYVVEQAIWALGNIGGDSANHRDHLLNLELMPYLLRIVENNTQSESLLKNSVWCISNLCRGKNPKPDYSMIKLALPLLVSLLKFSTDIRMLSDVCWSMSYLTNGDALRIAEITSPEVARKLVVLLRHPDYTIVSAVMRTIGNIVTGKDAQTQIVLDCGVLLRVKHFLDSTTISKMLTRDACWSVSNIAAGNRTQIQELFDANIVSSIINLMSEPIHSIKKEAAWTLFNLLSGGDVNQTDKLVRMECIDPVCNLLLLQDAKLVLLGLNCIEKILKAGRFYASIQHLTSNPYVDMVDECQGLAKIERLQNHTNMDIYFKAFSIMDEYFAELDDGFHAGNQI